MKKFFICTLSVFFLQLSYAAAQGYPSRIVSLMPAVTEILYELDAGDRLVGVTDYCNFPEDAKKKTRIGGYLDTNYEAIILLKPDLVIMSPDYNDELRDALDRAGISHMTVDPIRVEGMLSAIEAIGARIGAKSKAREVVARIRGDIEKVKAENRGKDPKRVMIVVGRNPGALENIYIAGRNTFHADLLEILGHHNVYTERDIDYPPISLERIVRLNPEVIIELLAGCPEEKMPRVVEEWNALRDVDAVKNKQVYVFNEDYIFIPGPRITLLLKKMQEIL